MEYLYATDILDALLAQSMRWVMVELFMPFAEVQRLHCIKGRTPLLKSLTFGQQHRNCEDFSMPIDPNFELSFEDSPSLTHLNLDVFTSIEGWKFDWSSMVVLRLKLPYAANLVDILSQSMGLEELEVIWPMERSRSAPIDIARSMITLSSLKKMKLPWNVVNLLAVLTAPVLQHLKIGDLDERYEIGIVAAFLRRSFCLESDVRPDVQPALAETSPMTFFSSLFRPRCVAGVC